MKLRFFKLIQFVAEIGLFIFGNILATGCYKLKGWAWHKVAKEHLRTVNDRKVNTTF